MEGEVTSGIVVDVVFALNGTMVPADHGFALFSALSRVRPELHDEPDLGVHPISGLPAGGRMLALDAASRLRVRLPVERVGAVIPLAGKRLEIAGCPISIGTPSLRLLEPASTLQSRLVVISGFLEATAFLEAVRRQLTQLDVIGVASLVPVKRAASIEGRASRPAGDYIRRTMAIHGREIVGFAVRVNQLTDEDSVKLQSAGLGGRHHFGCGIFTPLGKQA